MNITVRKSQGLFFYWAVATLMLGARYGAAQAAAADSTGFAPLDQWRAAVIAQDAAALKAFYSSTPAAQIEANGFTVGVDADVKFWLGLKARSVKVEIVRLKEKPEAGSVIFKAEVQKGTADGGIMN